MPIYVYQHKKSGHQVELLMPLAERDHCPPGYYRVEMPAPGQIHTERVGTIRGMQDPGGAAVKVPKALKEIERGERRGKAPLSARDISRHFGMPLDFIKRTWCIAMLLLLALLALPTQAGDLTRGTTLFDGQRVSASQLHTLVDGATINTSFYTGKPLDNTPNVADYILLYSSSAQLFEKITLGSAFLNNSSLITGASAATTLATNDLFLIYSQSGAQLEQIESIGVLTNFWLFTPQLNTNYGLGNRVMVWDGAATNYTMPLSNLASSVYTESPFKGSSTNTDWLAVLDGSTSNVFRIPWPSIYTNPPQISTVSNADTVLLWSFNTNNSGGLGLGNNGPARVPITNLWPTVFTSTNFAIPGSAGVVANIAHGLPGKPQDVRWVLVCTNADSGFVIGDEVPLSMPLQTTGSPNWSMGANATNVFLTFGAVNLQAINKNTGLSGTGLLTAINWNAKCYAWWFPR